ncbi:MAG: methylmalonyl Co-A mutase-associated GTPase MeaB [Paracoccaceae bacterium]|nr:methylmalonyl Co-A mutase-associated GTPase MeaB [Paracoccaceae bacterium]
MTDVTQLADALLSGDRRALARAITLIESGRADHRDAAEALLDRLAREGREALRVGLSGTPGVGKSTFIEAFGLSLTAAKKRVAVLAVDPSSARTGGSILGDKTRMERLTRDPRAYIRPSPSRSELGGVARRTREAIALCEAAGYDMVLVETVGVGQSETLVAEMTDLFVLLLAPAGGDELQGVKRGIMEIADLILVNKADGDLLAAATRTAADYAGALKLMRPRAGDPPGWPRVETVSALTGAGLAEARAAIAALAEHRQASGQWRARRRAQAQGWFEDELRREIFRRMATAPDGAEIAALAEAVASGERSAASAAREAADRLLSQPPPD